MTSLTRIAVLCCLALGLVDGIAQAQTAARTPPMGWNSWDAYGFTIDEKDFKANVAVLAGLKSFGWTYAVIDEGWYMEDPFGKDLASRKYRLDSHGLLIPVAARFPSAAKSGGFKPLADWVHAQGLKFGIHIVRGIPKQAVDANLSVGGARFHLADAADKSDTCPWDDGNYGVRDNEAGQAYYDSMLKLYAGWGLDFIKVDCIADRPYKASEIRQIAAAIKKTGRSIVLSLSPGPANLSNATELAEYAQMWRIADDLWDGWTFPHQPGSDFPNGLESAFDNLAKWVPHVKSGKWPDADMLPIGSLTPHPGWGDPRQSRLTRDETRSMLALWAIARSPMIIGGNLTRLNDDLRAMLTNRDLIDVNQTGEGAHQVNILPDGFEHVRVWVSSEFGTTRALALFNLDSKPVVLHAAWEQVGLPAGSHAWRDLWFGQAGQADGIDATLPPHGSLIFRID